MGDAYTVLSLMPVVVSAAIIALRIASSVASTVASNSAVMWLFDSIRRETDRVGSFSL